MICAATAVDSKPSREPHDDTQLKGRKTEFDSQPLSIPIQVADVCIYCINWGWRRGAMNAPTRVEIREQFAGWIRRLEYQDRRSSSYGETKKVYGIVFVQNPCGSGEP
jgi:hypothetical protein